VLSNSFGFGGSNCSLVWAARIDPRYVEGIGIAARASKRRASACLCWRTQTVRVRTIRAASGALLPRPSGVGPEQRSDSPSRWSRGSGQCRRDPATVAMVFASSARQRNGPRDSVRLATEKREFPQPAFTTRFTMRPPVLGRRDGSREPVPVCVRRRSFSAGLIGCGVRRQSMIGRHARRLRSALSRGRCTGPDQ